ncbi:hypothetical protein KIW84_055169 [Lathyrus oleraceus]|uniref:Uncharacterized protein n=1 Tax=Pisum sativum TaxID=3888 RepID=A0A9D5AJF6_PEA|nr:hypothetical protein KIW84_055169 [Pisum sativum]
MRKLKNFINVARNEYAVVEGSSDSKLSMCVRLWAAKPIGMFLTSVWNSLQNDVGRNSYEDNLPTSFYDAKGWCRIGFRVFGIPGRPSGKKNVHWLTQKELLAAHVHVLINCVEVKPYLEAFNTSYFQSTGEHPNTSDTHAYFPAWSKSSCHALLHLLKK